MNLALLLFTCLLSQLFVSTASSETNDYDQDEQETVEASINKELNRNREAKSNAFSSDPDQQQQGPGQPLPYKQITVHIPQYGKVIGRREEGIDIWRGIPYAGTCLLYFEKCVPLQSLVHKFACATTSTYLPYFNIISVSS